MIAYEVDTDIWLPVALVNAEDRESPETGIGADPTVLAFHYGMLDGSGSGNWKSDITPLSTTTCKELGNGMYEVRIEASKNTTKGILAFMIEHNTGVTLPYPGAVQVVAHDPEDAVDGIETSLSALTAALALVADDAEKARQGVSNRIKIDAVAKTLTIYDDGGSTPLYVFTLLDAAGALTDEEPFERVIVP